MSYDMERKEETSPSLSGDETYQMHGLDKNGELEKLGHDEMMKDDT
jgi:hypothetical protein